MAERFAPLLLSRLCPCQIAQSLLATALLTCWCFAVYSNRPAAIFSRAETALDEDDIEPLQYALLGLRNSRTYESHASLLSARLLLGEGRPDAALVVLEVAAAHRDTETRALNLTGESLYRLGRLTEAGEIWSYVAKRDPENVVALRWLGIAYYDLGAMKEAVQYLARAAVLAPSDAGPHRLMGLIWKQLGKYAEAVDAFQESLRRNPRQADVLAVKFEAAQCLHLRNQDHEALEMLVDCPPLPDVLALRARCEYACGRFEEAWSTADDALQLDERNVRALLLQATIANEQKKPAEAIARWNRVTQVDSCNREAHYQLAIAYRRLGRDAEAERERQVAEGLSQLQEDEQVTTEIAATTPNDIEARIKLGTICEQLHRYKAAREWFRAAVYLDPQNQTAKDGLVRLLKVAKPSRTQLPLSSPDIR